MGIATQITKIFGRKRSNYGRKKWKTTNEMEKNHGKNEKWKRSTLVEKIEVLNALKTSKPG